MVETIYNKYNDKLLRYAEGICQDTELSKDLVQYVYEKYLSNSIQKESEDHLLYSFKRSITNKYIDICRVKKRKIEYAKNMANTSNCHIDNTDRKIDKEYYIDLFRYILQGSRCSEMLNYVLMEYNYKEISEATGLKTETVKSRISQMKNKLQKKLIKT